MRYLSFTLIIFLHLSLFSQEAASSIENINLDQIPENSLQHYWLKMIDNGMSQSVYVPVIIAKGTSKGPVLGLTAAIHGNELNGIEVIRKTIEDIDIETLRGTIIAIPGLNATSIPLHQRRYFDDEDLNRNFPGKQTGTRTQQFVWQINEKILPHLDYLIDMHTASFGRENTFYVRADLSHEKMSKMASLHNADIILSSKGAPSTGDLSSNKRTMRAEAMLKGIPSITVEYGNPQVFQPELIERGKQGIENIMSWLGMHQRPISSGKKAVLCEKSYWIYIENGGYLEVMAQLNQEVKKDELIAVLRNPFGDVIKEYTCPEDGIVIGRSSNPINMSGGRIIHLGILKK